MAVKKGGGAAAKHETIKKRTSQGGRTPKTSTMNKAQKRNLKKYRGQGR